MQQWDVHEFTFLNVNADASFRRPGVLVCRKNVDGRGLRCRVLFRQCVGQGCGLGARCFREMLPRLAILKAGRGLDSGVSVIEFHGGEVQVVMVESGFEAWNFGTEPARQITVGVNGDANLTLLDHGMNLHRAECVSTHTDMHFGVHPGIGAEIERGGRGRRTGGSGRRGVEHLVSLGKPGCGVGSD